MTAFFRLLRETVAPAGARACPLTLSEGEWEEVFALFRRQALSGVGFSAVERWHELGAPLPTSVVLSWGMLAHAIERRNAALTEQCRAVAAYFSDKGFDCCVLKGQGNLYDYPPHLRCRRQSGDIDVWVAPQRPARHAVREVANFVLRAAPEREVRYHHVDWQEGAWAAEVHFRPTFMYNPFRNRRMQQWCREQAAACFGRVMPDGFAVPPPTFNAVYQLAHIYRHLFDEGIGLRQLMDYYFVLQALPPAAHPEVSAVLRRLGLLKFAAAAMWVLLTVFSDCDDLDAPDLAERYPWLLCRPCGREGRFLLDEVLLSGNFGQHDPRLARWKRHSPLSHALWKLWRNARFVVHYPEEVVCEPFFRLYHWAWRRFRWWRW